LIRMEKFSYEQKVIINEKSETITVDYVTNEQVSHLRNYLIFT
jgi:hypothetical protein